MRTSLFFVLLAAAAPAQAGESVFGLPLGERFTVPECKKMSYGYAFPSDAPCFQRITGDYRSTSAIVNESVRVRFPLNQAPAIASGAELIAIIMDGNLEGIGFNTRGISNQDEVLAALKGKYGEPSVFQPDKAQNRMGATFEIFTASWSTPSAEIRFQSTTGKITSGLVNVDTKKGSEWREQKLRELSADKKPL